jgi:hypothetical protein
VINNGIILLKHFLDVSQAEQHRRLSSIPYEKVWVDLPKIPKAAPRPKGVEEGLPAGQFVPNLY